VSALGCSLRSGDSNRGEFFADRIGYIIQQPAQKLGAAVEFITERLAFLAVFLECPSARKVPRQDSSTSPDRGWAVSLRRSSFLRHMLDAWIYSGWRNTWTADPNGCSGAFPGVGSSPLSGGASGNPTAEPASAERRLIMAMHKSKSLPGSPSGGE